MFQTFPAVELLTAPDGETALSTLAETTVQLVLLDITLPGMSGLEVFHAMKADPRMAAIPVIAVSAAAMLHDVAAGLDAGFSAYITKPFDVLSVRKTIGDSLKASGGDSRIPSVRDEPA